MNAVPSKGLSPTSGLSSELSPWSPESLERDMLPEIVSFDLLQEESGTSSDIVDVTLR